MRTFLFLALAALLVGCQKEEQSTSIIHDTGPLTVEEWKEMDNLVKYELDTFERLKEGNSKLNHPKNWDRFMKKVVVPERKKDIPSG